MRNLIGGAVLACAGAFLGATAAHAYGSDYGEPFICYGQTEVPIASSINDPTPSKNGLAGECPTLPYMVPQGQYLHITGYGVEGYGAPNRIVIFPWIGSTLTNQAALHSVQAIDGTNQASELRYSLPPGTIMHVNLQTGGKNEANWVYGWFVTGYLSPMP